MGLIARNFARPAGLVGGVVGRVMVRGNGGFNQAVVGELARRVPAALRIAELGCGPGVGLAGLLASFPAAEVVGVDLSSEMIKQSRRRNRAAVTSGRLSLQRGGAEELTGGYDLIVAVHVLYFWPDPAAVLRTLRAALIPGGTLALGYRCRAEMPALSQRDFPAEGYRLYDRDSDVQAELTSVGFRDVDSSTIGPPGPFLGRLTTARA